MKRREFVAGIALTGHKVFLKTNIDGRTKELAAAQIHESLKRLKTDHLDLSATRLCFAAPWFTSAFL
jgi:hypothetical protein